MQYKTKEDMYNNIQKFMKISKYLEFLVLECIVNTNMVKLEIVLFK